MSLNKQKMVREISNRTHVTNGDVRKVLHALFEGWIQELANSGRIEIENFMVMEIEHRDHEEGQPQLRRLMVRPSRSLRARLSVIQAKKNPAIK